MKVLTCTLLLVLALASAAPAAEPVAQTFNAPADRVWTVVEAVLKQLGWEIDKKDRTIGMIGTDSRRVDGENYGVYARGRRHRLTLYVKAASDNRTTVTVERDVERSILSAIAKAL